MVIHNAGPERRIHLQRTPQTAVLAKELGYVVFGFVDGDVTEQEYDRMSTAIIAEWTRLKSTNPHSDCEPDSFDGLKLQPVTDDQAAVLRRFFAGAVE